MKKEFDMIPLTPKQREMKDRIYDSKMKDVGAEEYDKFILERGRDEKARMFAGVLSGLIDEEKRYSALELGSGTGIFTNELNKIKNVDLTCLDLREDFIKYGIDKERIKKEQVVIGNFEEQPFEQGSFDILTGMAIMNQRDDQEKFFSEIRRTLKDGGLVFFPWLKKRKDKFERELKLLKENGFKILQTGEDYILAKKSAQDYYLYETL